MSIATVGVDLAKSVSQADGLGGEGEVALRRKLERSEVIPSLTKLASCMVVMEACGAAHG
jgi:transposase